MQGAPNFRQVGGFPVFGVGQPSPAGVQALLERTKPSPEEKPGKERRTNVDIWLLGLKASYQARLINIVGKNEPFIGSRC